jgi:hypothetical protein
VDVERVAHVVALLDDDDGAGDKVAEPAELAMLSR